MSVDREHWLFTYISSLIFTPQCPIFLLVNSACKYNACNLLDYGLLLLVMVSCAPVWATPSCIPVSGPPPTSISAKSTFWPLFYTAHAQIVVPPLLYSRQPRDVSQDGKLPL